jgi:hypothetical protein
VDDAPFKGSADASAQAHAVHSSEAPGAISKKDKSAAKKTKKKEQKDVDELDEVLSEMSVK